MSPIRLSIVGNDQPQLLERITAILETQDARVEQWNSRRSGAPMSAQTLFTAQLKVRLPAPERLPRLRQALESLSSDLMVDIEGACEHA